MLRYCCVFLSSIPFTIANVDENRLAQDFEKISAVEQIGFTTTFRALKHSPELCLF